ncbi:MAG: PP2C family protein-serine/threonine phosphatase [Phycisphaerae bacterium]|nr:PP2C family protein-serine/threonine phosphatase [Phycisphaerae bacterium]
METFHRQLKLNPSLDDDVEGPTSARRHTHLGDKLVSDKPVLLWVGAVPVPVNVRAAADDHWQLRPYRPDKALAPQLRQATLAVVYPNSDGCNPQYLGTVLMELASTPAVAIFLLDEQAEVARRMLSRRRGQFLCTSTTTPAEMLAAHFLAARALQPVIAELRSDLHNLRQSNRNSSAPAETIDEEIRLAARLQRDFLPRRLPEVGSARFGVLYHPASFVSGDIYDITRLDETHVGFYVADAIGHGMPAALLTMFIKKALQTKRVFGNTYEIVPPEVSLTELNEDICGQDLSSCQFCTVVYAVLDTAELTVTYARAGHPEPILVRRDGSVELLEGEGCLLGAIEGQTFEPRQVRLAVGDRIILYTDGAHDAVRRGSDRKFHKILGGLLTLPKEQLLTQLTTRIEAGSGQGQPSDDITVVVMDVER